MPYGIAKSPLAKIINQSIEKIKRKGKKKGLMCWTIVCF
jgi:hypothetical protein